LALRELSSGPWQLKHLLAIRGRICELKSTGSIANCFFAPAAAAPIAQEANKVRAVSRARTGIWRFMQLSQRRALASEHSIPVRRGESTNSCSTELPSREIKRIHRLGSK